jgi:hypothetical protein
MAVIIAAAAAATRDEAGIFRARLSHESMARAQNGAAFR